MCYILKNDIYNYRGIKQFKFDISEVLLLIIHVVFIIYNCGHIVSKVHTVVLLNTFYIYLRNIFTK